MIGKTLAVALAMAVLSGCAASAAPQTPTADHKGTFDNTFYTNVDLQALGLTKSNVVYEQNWITAAGQTGTPPDKNQFQKLVSDHSANPGPVVLDFESLYLTGSPETAQHHFAVLWAVAGWAHEAAPGHPIGFYGLDGHTDQQYLPLAKQLATREDAFFPTLYTLDENVQRWNTTLRTDLAQAHEVAPQLPVYPYLWPQYHDATATSFRALPASRWRSELEATYQQANGFVIWSRQVPVPVDPADRQWLTATKDFLANHR